MQNLQEIVKRKNITERPQATFTGYDLRPRSWFHIKDRKSASIAISNSERIL